MQKNQVYFNVASHFAFFFFWEGKGECVLHLDIRSFATNKRCQTMCPNPTYLPVVFHAVVDTSVDVFCMVTTSGLHSKGLSYF